MVLKSGYRRCLHSFPTRRSSDLPPRTATSYWPLALNTKSVLDPNDARDMSDDVLSLPPFDFVVDDAGEQDAGVADRSEEHTSELQSLRHLVCRLLLEKTNAPHIT